MRKRGVNQRIEAGRDCGDGQEATARSDGMKKKSSQKKTPPILAAQIHFGENLIGDCRIMLQAQGSSRHLGAFGWLFHVKKRLKSPQTTAYLRRSC